MPKSSKRKADTRAANKDRKQRLEELRRQQRAAERRKNFLFAGSAIVIAIVLIGLAILLPYLHDRAQKAKEAVGYQAAPTAAEKAAGCLGVHNDPDSPAAQHTTSAIDYATQKYGDTEGGTQPIPPSGGTHNPIPLSDQNRFYPLSDDPRAERAVHNLEHGFIDVWYDKQLPADQVSKLKELATDPTMPRLLVVGWTQGDKVLPADKHVVLTSWARTDRCSTVSPEVVKAFYNAHVNTLAPEAGGAAGPASCAADQLECSTGTPTPTPSASPSSKKS